MSLKDMVGEDDDSFDIAATNFPNNNHNHNNFNNHGIPQQWSQPLQASTTQQRGAYPQATTHTPQLASSSLAAPSRTTAPTTSTSAVIPPSLSSSSSVKTEAATQKKRKRDSNKEGDEMIVGTSSSAPAKKGRAKSANTQQESDGGDFFDSLMGSMNETHQNQLRAKEAMEQEKKKAEADLYAENVTQTSLLIQGMPAFSANLLPQYPEHAVLRNANNAGETVQSSASTGRYSNLALEFEVRLGVKLGNNFVAGVTEEDWANIKNFLRKSPDFDQEFTRKMDYTYDKEFADSIYGQIDPQNATLGPTSSGNFNALRLTYDLKDKTNISMTAAIIKHKIPNQAHDLPWNNILGYDTRLSLSKEETLPLPDTVPNPNPDPEAKVREWKQGVAPDGWASKRLKDRWTFKPKKSAGLAGYWIIDVTEVTSYAPPVIPPTLQAAASHTGPSANKRPRRDHPFPFEYNAKGIEEEHKSYEIEIEMVASGQLMQRIKAGNISSNSTQPHIPFGGNQNTPPATKNPVVIEMCTNLWAFVIKLCGFTNNTVFSNPNTNALPANQNDSALPFEGANKVVDKALITELKKSVCHIIAGPDYSSDKFPGSMPVAFSRRYYPRLQSHDYYVSEKTDGVRYMMYIRNAGKGKSGQPNHIYLIDRKFDFYRITEKFRALGGIYATNGDTLIDGELVKHQKTKNYAYMIFDLLMYDGNSIAAQSLAERLKAIGEWIIKPYRMAIDEKEIDKNSVPFTLIGKLFYPKNSIKRLLDQIIVPKGSHERYFSEKPPKDNSKDETQLRYHKTDGLIFTPNEAYSPKGTWNLFKWKYRSLITMDFKLIFDEGEKLYLGASGDHGAEEIKSRDVDFTYNDTFKVCRYIRDAEWKRNKSKEVVNIILECGFNTDNGRWFIHANRVDKNMANHIKVITDAWESIAENITDQEILQICTQTHSRHSSAHHSAAQPHHSSQQHHQSQQQHQQQQQQQQHQQQKQPQQQQPQAE